MKTSSYWIDTVPGTAFPKVESDLRVDVLIVGGGITGLTAAYLLRRAGKSVAVVERNRIGMGETGHTTAHLTYATDARLTDLVTTFGRDHAQAAWDAAANAIAQIRSIVEKEGMACELRAAPAFLVAAEEADAAEEGARLRAEADLATEMGFDVSFVEAAPLLGRPALRFANQWRFHPMKYAQDLARRIARMGGQVFEETEVTAIHDDPLRAVMRGFVIRFDRVFFATHVPLQGSVSTLSAALFQTKLAGYSTYAIRARIPSGALPEMLWWDTGDPYLYLRVDHDEKGDAVVFGGEDHKTGQETDTGECFRRLERKLAKLVPEAKGEQRWSGQVIEPVDGLPYIGEVADGQFLATGFAGNGMTFGTLAGMMVCDWVLGVVNPWRELFYPARKSLRATWDYLRENSSYPFYLAKGHLAATERGGVDALRPGEGKIVRAAERRVAAFRDDQGRTHVLSPICPHLGCTVAWNEAEKTWDCPCHGSRFTATGELMAGPAESGLETLDG